MTTAGMLDAQAHPRILSAVLTHADRGALLALRGASKDLRARADALLVAHVCMYMVKEDANTICELVTAPHGRIPAFMPADGMCWLEPVGPRPASAQEQLDRIRTNLEHTRVLDIVIGCRRICYEPHTAYNLLLGPMNLHTLRQFPNNDGSIFAAPEVHAKISVFFVVPPPLGLICTMWMEHGRRWPVTTHLQGAQGSEKTVVHILHNDDVGAEHLFMSTSLGVKHTVWVLNSYRSWFPAYHRRPRSVILPDNHRSTALKAHVRETRGSRRLNTQWFRGTTPLTEFISDSLVGGGECTVVNLGAHLTSIGFDPDSDPHAVELVIRDRIQASWRRSYDTSKPNVPPLPEQRAAAMTRLAFLSRQEYANTLTPHEALDEGFVSYVPGESVRPRHFLPRPARRARANSAPLRPSTPPSRHMSTFGPQRGTLELASYPHIADLLVAVASYQALLSLRGVCRLFREKVDARFMRHLIIDETTERDNRCKFIPGPISSPLGPVPALRPHSDLGTRERFPIPKGRKPPAPALVERTKRLLSLTRVLDIYPNQSHLEETMWIALDLQCVRTFRTYHEPYVPFPARTLVYYHTAGADVSCDEMHRPRNLVPDLCSKVVHHIFPRAESDAESEYRIVGFDRLWTRLVGVSTVVVVFTPHHPALTRVNYGMEHPSIEDRRAYLVRELAKALTDADGEALGRSVTLVNAHLIPHAWLGLPDDWDVVDILAAEVRNLVSPARGHFLRCVTGEDYAAELSADELEMEGTIEAIPGVRHRLLPYLKIAEGAEAYAVVKALSVWEPTYREAGRECEYSPSENAELFERLPFSVPIEDDEHDEDEAAMLELFAHD
ncbi:hypothetical protein CC85DRAFT_88847 [Cutaneotrichosporon oleaginosum]|uniref:Uncharacterized protein n=1 Tax=Cutaneotrichosporon oleaginosum TaxID=879819 RepID=A0A0J1BCY1_9TREE|nr:uncharacterized protein CC85DRAFT_88847 [Cutaneotrichosporon oleaginosum]KLT45904.1 hypothetical protein CC85DRAFT_88847 [Cutaneotrichosporon oleaginosum]TXT06602.1 hypothetical protein COLE_05933 [Cutaneotrichosporon oleaginosum]